MTTRAISVPRPDAGLGDGPRGGGFGAVLRAEWTKFRSVRGWVIGMILAASPGRNSVTFAPTASTDRSGPPRSWPTITRPAGMLFGGEATGLAYSRGVPARWGDEGGGMPIPRIVRRWNKSGLNRVTKHIFPWTPGFGVVIHRGRRSGRLYQTPVNVFAAEDGYLFALTYGPDTDWVKNVLAAGGCELRTRGRVIRLVSPRVFHDESRRGVRPLERQVLRIIGVVDFLSLKIAPAVPTTGPS